ncbi:hypothetical protein FKM82_025904 [Ascaphus truei]
MLCSMANSGCLLLSSTAMIPHSMPGPPAFLYLQQGCILLQFVVMGPPPPYTQRRGQVEGSRAIGRNPTVSEVTPLGWKGFCG